MAHLINCFECGAEVSSEAGRCPKCNSPVEGYRCRVCKNLEKKENLRYLKGSKSAICPACYKKVHAEYHSFITTFLYSCSLCKYSWKPLINNTRDKCPKCGHPIQSKDRIKLASNLYKESECKKCRLPLIAIVSKEIKFKNFPYWVHQWCYENNKSYYDDIDRKYRNVTTEKHKNTTCFIATALYGENSIKVKTLCSFRDEHLATTGFGRAFISLYVRISPPLARAIATPSLLRTLTRYCIVTPALFIAKLFVNTENQR